MQHSPKIQIFRIAKIAENNNHKTEMFQLVFAAIIKPMSIAPHQATIEETGELVNVEVVKPGTILVVKTGEVILIDGLVVEGSCEVDEKALTEETFPVAKQKDFTVLVGTIKVNGNSFTLKQMNSHSEQEASVSKVD